MVDWRPLPRPRRAALGKGSVQALYACLPERCLVGSSDQIHGAADALDKLAGHTPIGEIAVLIELAGRKGSFTAWTSERLNLGLRDFRSLKMMARQASKEFIAKG